jgi:hypothetical protein
MMATFSGLRNRSERMNVVHAVRLSPVYLASPETMFWRARVESLSSGDMKFFSTW